MNDYSDLNAVRFVASRIPRPPVQLPKSKLRLRVRPGSGYSDATVLGPKQTLPEGSHLDHKSGMPSKMSDKKPAGYKAPLLKGAKRVRPSAPSAEPGVARGLKPQPGGEEPVDLNHFDHAPASKEPKRGSWEEKIPHRTPETPGEDYDQKVAGKPASPGTIVPSKANIYRPGSAPREVQTARTLQRALHAGPPIAGPPAGGPIAMRGQRALGPASTPSALAGRQRTSSGPGAGYMDTPLGTVPIRRARTAPGVSFNAPAAPEGRQTGGVSYLHNVPPAATTPHPRGNAGLVDEVHRNISKMQFPSFRSMP